MLNALDNDTQVQELILGEIEEIVAAEQHEQLMKNQCTDEMRSFI